jgi:hypothetical protein
LYVSGERELSAAHFSSLSEERWARSQISERLPALYGTYGKLACMAWRATFTFGNSPWRLTI